MSNSQCKAKEKKFTAWAVLFLFSIQTFLPARAFADTIATPDPAQGKAPVVGQAANGTIVVNIRTPNGRGLSHNQYKNLQIGQGGIIFNNSRNISNTQLAGYINGNQYLGAFGASRILNEVTGPLPTNINGYMEIAGQRADLIIANPNGIAGGNFGFINANRATLAAGIPNIGADGRLKGFTINGGEIAIGGQGMDARSASKTDIIANAVKINAALHANELSIVTGGNETDYETGGSKALSTEDQGGISLDVSALGGMYAGSISLVGTRQGVGVNSEGIISAASGGLTVTQEGKVVLRGKTQADGGNVSIGSQDGIAQAGTLYAKGGGISLASQEAIDNANGIVKADKALDIMAQGTLSNGGGILEAESVNIQSASLGNSAGAIDHLGTGTMSVATGGLDNSLGTMVSNGGMSIDASDINSAGGTIYAKESIGIDAKAGMDNTGGLIHSGKALEIKAGGGITNNQLGGSGGSIEAQGISIESASLTSDGNILALDGSLSLAQKGETSLSGMAYAKESIGVESGDIEQKGTLYAESGGMEINAKGAVDNAGGTIKAGKGLAVAAAGTLSNDGGAIEAESIALQSASLGNREGTINQLGSGTLSIATGGMDNAQGAISSSGSLDIKAGGINNEEGALYSQEDAQIAAGGGINNTDGVIAAEKGLSINAAGLLENGKKSAGGYIQANGLDIKASTLNNAGSTLSSLGRLSIDTGDIDNGDGQIAAFGKLSVSAGAVGNAGGLFYAEEDAKIEAACLGGDGEILSQGSLALGLKETFTNTGAVQAGADLSITSEGSLVNRKDILAGGALSIASANIDNQVGGTIAADSLSLGVAGAIDNTGLANGSGVNLKADTISNTGTGRIYGDNLSIEASTLNNTASAQNSPVIAAREFLAIGAGTINNKEHALILSEGDMEIGGALNNNSATIEAKGRLSINAQTIDNTNEHFSTQNQIVNVEEGIVEYAASGSSKRYLVLWPGSQDPDGSPAPLPPVVPVPPVEPAPPDEPTPPEEPYDKDSIAWIAYDNALKLYQEEEIPSYEEKLGEYQEDLLEYQEDLDWYNYELSMYPNTPPLYPIRQGLESYLYYGSHGAGSKNATTDVWTFYVETTGLHTPEGATENWTAYRYTRTTYEDVVKESDPGQIISGRDMAITAGTLTNDKSRIAAGGSLKISADSINNIEAEGKRRFVEKGTATSYWRRKRKGIDTTGFSVAAYSPADTAENIVVGAAEYEENAQGQSGGQAAEGYAAAGVKKIAAPGATIASELDGMALPGGASLAGTAGGQPKPQEGLYSPSKDPGAKYFMETDPAFANFQNFISSDYFFAAMQYDPDTVAKRLGDAYYEQQLVKGQILALTGNRYLKGFTDDNGQYQALLDSAAKFAKESGAQIGVELTNAQIAGLAESLVWMVEKEILLPDGQIVKALVPEVYIVGDETGGFGSALISAQDIDFDVTNDILNKGTIKAGDSLKISAANINNIGGSIKGSDVALNALKDITNKGGGIEGINSVRLAAGRDINIESSLNAQENAQGHVSNIGAVGSVRVTGANGALGMEAGRDISLKAAAIENLGAGDTIIAAQRDLNLSTVETSQSQNLVWDAHNKRSEESTAEVGSFIGAGGNLSLAAGGNLTARAAAVSAAGDMAIAASGGVSIEAGRATSSVTEGHRHKGTSGGGSSMTIATHDEERKDLSIGSVFAAGGNISITAGNGLGILGSGVESYNGKISLAGENVSIAADTDSIATLNTYDEQRKGLLRKKSVSEYSYRSGEYAAPSTVSGNEIQIAAKENILVAGSDVVATREVSLAAGQNIEIVPFAEESSGSHYRQEKKSGFLSGGGLGFTIGTRQQKDQAKNTNIEQVGSVVGSIAGSVNIDAGKDVGIAASDIIAGGNITIEGKSVTIESKDNVYAFWEKHEFKQTGLTVSLGGNGMNAINSVYAPLRQASSASSDRLTALYGAKAAWNLYGNWKTLTNLKTKDFAINVGFGSTKFSSETDSVTTIAQGSNVIAGGDANIAATETDLAIKGSNVEGDGVTLAAKENINVMASQNANIAESESKNSSFGIGVSVGLGKGGKIGGYIEAGKGNGNILQNGTTHNESTVNAENKLQTTSGNDTNITGAQLKGNSVKIYVGGSLSIESRQDTDNYTETNRNASLSVSGIGIGAPGVSGGVSKQNINSSYASVWEPAGIWAGEGGFDGYVGEDTTLTGGIIASEGRLLHLSTGRFGWSDIQNHASYSADTSGLNLNSGLFSGKSKDIAAGLLGIVTPGLAGGSGDSAESATKSAVSAGEIQIRGNPEQDLANLSRDPASANNALAPIFDREKILEKQEAAAVFGEIAFGVIGDIAHKMGWKEGGAEKVLLHALIGGLIAEINGGKFGDGLTVGAVNELVIGMLDRSKEKTGLTKEEILWITNLLGKAVGGSEGQGIAGSATGNNYLSHRQQTEWQEKIADCQGNKDCIDRWNAYFIHLDLIQGFDSAVWEGDFLDYFYDDLYYGEGGNSKIARDLYSKLLRPDDPNYTDQDFYQLTTSLFVPDTFYAYLTENPRGFLSLGAIVSSKSLPIAADFLSHGLNGDGQDREFGNDSAIAQAIKNNNSFAAHVNDIVKKAEGNIESIINQTDRPYNEYEFSAADSQNARELLLAIGKYNLWITDAVKNPDGSIEMQMKIIDDYDFKAGNESFRDARGLGYVSLLNNIAVIAERTGKLTKYTTTINFVYTYSPHSN
jgi:filamentous hemagglutinin